MFSKSVIYYDLGCNVAERNDPRFQRQTDLVLNADLA